jgi:hypothetical protein
MSDCRNAMATGMAATGFGHPDAVVHTQSIGDDQRDVGLRSALILAQLSKPIVCPVLGPL